MFRPPDYLLQPPCPNDVTRRHAVGSILQAALLAHPLGSRLLVLASLSTLICFVVAGAIPPR